MNKNTIILSPFPMDILPIELVDNVLGFVDIQDCINLSQTNSRMRKICMYNLTRKTDDECVNKILSNMRDNNFYDYDIIKTKKKFLFNLYELRCIISKFIEEF